MQQLSLLLFQFGLFLLLALCCFYIPGYIAIKMVRQELNDEEFIPLAFSLGFIFFLINLVIWGFLNLRLMVYLPIGLCLLWVLYHDSGDFLQPFGKVFKNKLLVGLLLLGIIIEGLINFPSGYNYG